MGDGELEVEPDGLENVLTVRVEGLQPGRHPVLDVTGQTLDVHRQPVRVVVSHLNTIERLRI